VGQVRGHYAIVPVPCLGPIKISVIGEALDLRRRELLLVLVLTGLLELIRGSLRPSRLYHRLGITTLL
jgi:hypothetical protein